MKKIIFLFSFYFVFTLNLSANNQNIKPITNNYSEIIEINNEIVALGNYGVIAIINQNTNEITKIKVFDKGVILSLYNLNDKVIAINNFGQIAESNIDLKKWNLIKNNNFKSKSIQLIILDRPDDFLLLKVFIQMVRTPLINSTNVRDSNLGRLFDKCEELEVITVTSIPFFTHSSDK